MVQVIPLKYGAVFKHVFSDAEIFSAFATAVLGFEVKVDEVHTEYEYPEPIGFVHTKYDLFAEDVENRIIVEIQQVKEEDFFDRFLYYHIISLAEQVKGYFAYRFEKTVHTIVVLTSTPRDGSIDFSVAVSQMDPVDELGKKLEIYPHHLVFLAPRNVNEKTPEPLKSWLELMVDSLDSKVDESHHNSETFQKIIERMTRTPVLLEEVKDEAAFNMAIERHKAEGKAEGLAEGELKGKSDASKEIALRMLAEGVSDEIVARTTGLELQTIEKLKRQGN